MQIKVALLILSITGFLSATNVSTGSYDNSRTGANTAETAFTHSSVTARFGKLGTYTVDGDVYGQPLVASGKLIVATMHNSIYAFDATNPGSAEIWKVNVGAPYTTYPDFGITFPGLEVGICSTPVVDSGVVYFVSSGSAGTIKIYALNIADGSTFHAAVTVAGTYSTVTFDPVRHLSRAALLFANNRVYVAYTGYADISPYQGWVMAHNKTTLAIEAVWSDTVNNQAGIWMSGGGPAADGSGNIYLATGNGSLTLYPNSFVKLDADLNPLDYATPADYATLNSTDSDLGSGRVILTGTYVMGGGKDGRWWRLNQGAMGHLQGGGGNPPIAQVWQASTHSIFAGAAFANSALFLAATSDSLRRFEFNGSTFTETATFASAATFSFSSAISYSSNGATANTDIVWALTRTSGGVPTFRAMNATTGAELWNSEIRAAGSDSLPSRAKFNPPTVCDGRVFAATFSNKVVAYGLLVAALYPTQMEGSVQVTGKVEFH